SYWFLWRGLRNAVVLCVEHSRREGMKHLVANALRERLQALLPPRRFRFPGRKPLDYRKVLIGIAWDNLPVPVGYGYGKTSRDYLQAWHRAVFWQQLHAVSLGELNAADQLEWSRALIDAAIAKGPEAGEETRRNPPDRCRPGSISDLMTNTKDIPLS